MFQLRQKIKMARTSADSQLCFSKREMLGLQNKNILAVPIGRNNNGNYVSVIVSIFKFQISMNLSKLFGFWILDFLIDFLL